MCGGNRLTVPCAGPKGRGGGGGGDWQLEACLHSGQEDEAVDFGYGLFVFLSVGGGGGGRTMAI